MTGRACRARGQSPPRGRVHAEAAGAARCWLAAQTCKPDASRQRGGGPLPAPRTPTGDRDGVVVSVVLSGRPWVGEGAAKPEENHDQRTTEGGSRASTETFRCWDTEDPPRSAVMLGRRPARDRARPEPGHRVRAARRAELACPSGGSPRAAISAPGANAGRRQPASSDRARPLRPRAAPNTHLDTARRSGSSSRTRPRPTRRPADQTTPQTTKLQSIDAGNCNFVGCGEHRQPGADLEPRGPARAIQTAGATLAHRPREPSRRRTGAPPNRTPRPPTPT
jgi:hypothetical protein